MKSTRPLAFARARTLLPLALLALAQLDCSASPSTGAGGSASTTTGAGGAGGASTTSGDTSSATGPGVTASSSGTCGAMMPCCVNNVCPEVVVDKLDAVAGLAEQGSDLFYLGSVDKVAKSGGQPPVAIVSGTTGSFAVDPANVFWVDGSGTTLWRANLDGTNTKLLASLDGQQYPHAIALDDTDVYITAIVTKAGSSCTAVQRISKMGGAAAEVAYACDSAKPYAIALNSTDVFWGTLATPTGGALYTAPKTSASMMGTQLAKSNNAPVTRIVADDTTVFYLQNGVLKLDPKNPAGATHVMTTMMSILSFTVDATDVFLAGGGGVTKVGRTSQQETLLATGTATTIAVDATSVYFGAGGQGMAKILKIGK